MSDQQNARRSFLSRLLVGTAAAIAVPAVYAITRFLRPPRTLPAELRLEDDNLPAADESPSIVRVGVKSAAVMRAADGSIRALSLTCTHTGCSVHWREHAQLFHCPCHYGTFARSGAVISGPPRRALERLRVVETVAGVTIIDETA